VKIVAIVGTGSGSGKTTVACRLLQALPGLGAVKISPRDGEARVERGPGVPGKDTACYAAAGAVKVARVVGPRGSAARAWGGIVEEFRGLPGVIVEGAGSLELPGSRMTVLVADASFMDRVERNSRLASVADVILVRHPTPGDEVAIVTAISNHIVDPSVIKARALADSRNEEWNGFVSTVRAFLDSTAGGN
jgi:hypothetical protein